MQRIVIERADGGVSFMQLVPGADAAEAVAKWADLHGAPVSWQAADVALPGTGRAFRNAWRWTAGAIDIDMVQARDIHAARLAVAIAAEDATLARIEAAARLAGRAADADAAQASRAAIAGLNRTAIGAQIGAAPTPDALLAVWPAELAARRPA